MDPSLLTTPLLAAGLSPELLPKLLLIAVLLPLLSFFLILLFANSMGKSSALLATGAIGGAAVLSFVSFLFIWLPNHWPQGSHHAEAHAEKGHAGEAHPTGAAAANEHDTTGHVKSESHDADHHGHDAHHAEPPVHYTGEYYVLAQFGNLRIPISYYIDSLTVCMFCMVTLIATCIHFYAMGYMHDELHPVTDHEVQLADGHELHRPGRFPRFFQALSLFCFSMLGLVLSGNIFMVFVFWELVGICSYFLIGFYVERKSASTAANKAFIVNRVGDFGMIIGLMALWSSLGTFAFGDIDYNKDQQVAADERGIFSQVRTPENDFALETPFAMAAAESPVEVNRIIVEHENQPDGQASIQSEIASRNLGYWLLFVAGVGIFCGCIGKSAQFPLHVWLPDAMEGPTPVSALVHSATMVAAGVYLVGRFYPVFSPEVLLVIASVGCITLLIGATIAITATDIKRVLAYSTVSQLGYMMLALGVGGWAAGLMHLITHAFFKSLLFMCSGSVIHAVHTNDMRKMGGLWYKMPVTAITMLIGCLAIAGVGLPFVIGFSGYYSKDAILEQAYLFAQQNQTAYSAIFFVMAAGGAAITAFYMFRMWYLTFVGQPRHEHAYEHAHESPPVMFLPLVVLAVFAISVAWKFSLIGYGLIAAAFFVVRGAQKGWFRHIRTVEGHGDHGHDAHAHATHGHDTHGHQAHGHGTHGAHPPVAHAHAHQSGSPEIEQETGGLGRAENQPAALHPVHAHAGPRPGDVAPITHAANTGLTWSWVGAMLVCTILGGLLIQGIIEGGEWGLGGETLASRLTLVNLLEQSRPAGTLANQDARWLAWTWPNEHDSHAPAIAVPVTLLATGTWLGGIGLATLMYWFGRLNAEDVRRQFAPLYRTLVNKWYFDELYNAIFVRPTMVLSRMIALFDRGWIDWLIDNLGRSTIWIARRWEFIADQGIVDGTVNVLAAWTYSLGHGMHRVQTGRLRQYVLFIVVGAVALFILISFVWTPTFAAKP